jgi:hypothetical protein
VAAANAQTNEPHGEQQTIVMNLESNEAKQPDMTAHTQCTEKLSAATENDRTTAEAAGLVATVPSSAFGDANASASGHIEKRIHLMKAEAQCEQAGEGSDAELDRLMR